MADRGASAAPAAARRAPGGRGLGPGFGGLLASLESLGTRRRRPPPARQALAAGTVTDPTEVVMAVERARLSMQLASQVRTKAVEAVQDIFHTQV